MSIPRPVVTVHLYSPFEEMDPPVSLQHSESKGSESQESGVARHILTDTQTHVLFVIVAPEL